ncbi:hypothetical protein P3S67_001219 [Capsicum chacoense]
MEKPLLLCFLMMTRCNHFLSLEAQVPGTSQDHLQICNIEAKQKMKSYQMPEQMLGLVTQTSVYHWPTEGTTDFLFTLQLFFPPVYLVKFFFLLLMVCFTLFENGGWLFVLNNSRLSLCRGF